jgi:Fur family peroxide stress response transcriptional regulator
MSPTRNLAAAHEVLKERCKKAGLALTPQRLAIYQALYQSLDHPSPESLFDRVRPQMPSISLATIYKTLETLVAIGVASELPSAGDTKRYDANMGPHHHLVCDQCHAIEDFYDASLDLAAPKGRSGFVPRAVSVYVHGLCRRCSKSARA